MKIITPSAEATQPQSVNSRRRRSPRLPSDFKLHWMASENNFSCLCSARKLHPILADNDLDAISHIIGLLCETTAINMPGDDAVSMCRAPVDAKHVFCQQFGCREAPQKLL